MDNKKTPKEFICEKCHLKCFKPSDYKRHLGTAKHKKDKKKHTNAYVEINTNIIQVYIVIRRSVIIIPPEEIKELSMWRTLFPSIKKDNGIGHCGRTRSFSI